MAASLRRSAQPREALELSDELLAQGDDSAVVWNEKGAALSGLGRHHEAVRAFDRALALDPLNDFALVWKVGALKSLGDKEQLTATFDHALRSARKTLAHDPENLLALQWEVSSLRFLRRLEEAEERCAVALGHHPDDVFLLNEAAALDLGRGRLRQARELAEQALETEPHNEFAHWVRLRSLRTEGRFDQAHEALDGLPEALGGNHMILLERGLLVLQEGRAGEAEDILRAAVAAAEASLDAVSALSTALERQGKYDEALRCLEDFQRRLPHDLDVLEQIGWFHLRRNRLDQARKAFRGIDEADHEHLGGLNARGALAFTDERYQEAAEVFRKMTEKDPSNPTWHSNLAWALVRADEGHRRDPSTRRFFGLIPAPPTPLEEAEERCRRALSIDPLHPQAHGCLGVIAYRRGRHREAEAHFERSMERDRLEGSLTDLAALWAKIGKEEQAEALLREALAANPGDPTARIELGSLLVGLGRTEEAIREFRQAVASAPESPRPARALALALIDGKRWHEAEDELRQAIPRIEPHRRWQLHLTLSHLLVLFGDENDADSQLYEEARRAVDEARQLRPDDPEVAFQAGVVWYRLEAYGRSLRNFRRCAELDPEKFEAVRNVERLRRLVRRARLQERGGAWESLLLVGISLLQLVGAWVLFFAGRLKEGSLLTFASVSLGLLVVALLLPWLSRLKLPGGFEAQLAERTPAISPGPGGEGSLGTESMPRSQATISSVLG